MNVLIADKFEKAGVEGARALGLNVVYAPDAGAQGLATLLAEHRPEVLVVRSTKVPAAAIAGAPTLRLIIRAGAGVDNIDVAAATKAGIRVCNCPGMNAAAVAELAMGLLIACDRRLCETTAELKAGRWNKKEFGKARGLKGTTLGIVGFGNIGREVARRARAFEMELLAWSHSLTPEVAAEYGVEITPDTREGLLDLARRSDAVSVHVAATPQTAKLIDREFFAAMKPGAIFINTSRGSVVDETALREAIAGKGIRAGLDVYEQQPGEPIAEWQSPTALCPGVVCSHHIGASTEQAQNAVAEETVRILRVYKETGRAENCVNP